MTTVIILPETQNGNRFSAVSGKKQSFGTTMGEALDALAENLDECGNNDRHEHFNFNSNTREIEALSEMGRGTLVRLRINRKKQRQARRGWHLSEDITD